MGSTLVFIGAGIIAVSSAYLFSVLIKMDGERRQQNTLLRLEGHPEKDNNPFPTFFAIICLAVFFFSINLIASTAYESYNYCSLVPVNITGNATSNQLTYGNVCVTNSGNNAGGLVDLTNFWNVSILTLFGGMILYYLFQFIRAHYDQYNRYQKK